MSRLLLWVLCFVPIVLSAQSQQYSRVKISLLENSITQLSELGVEVDHGTFAPYRYIINEYSQEELTRIQEAGFSYEVLIEDVVSYYQSPNRESTSVPTRVLNECNAVLDSFQQYPYTTPENYTYGSMGGYLTYAELLLVLDDMHEKYPNLISKKEKIGDYETTDGNNILWIRLSDNPEIDEDEPEVLYTALHHAREPNSLAQMVFYLWYMLENYETDSYVRYLVDNTEMYFIPVVNPDGYIYNETIEPDGGGLWRKNRHDNEDGSHGVDLNRNYGHFWAFDNQGSSFNPSSSTYRGTEAFSEIETQAVADFCLEHDFKISQNYHSFGNLLIHPWGYNDLPTEEDSIFKAFGREMIDENNFVLGTGTETVGYVVNGDSDDWMYGEQIEKNKIYSFTPEVGGQIDGFWPDQKNIDYLNRSNVLLNQKTAHLSADLINITESSAAPILIARENNLFFDVQMLGLSGGRYALTLLSDSPYVQQSIDQQNIELDFWEKQQVVFPYSISEDASSFTEIPFQLLIDNGSYTDTLEISKVYMGTEVTSELVVQEDFTNIENWNSDIWGPTGQDFISPPFSMTDSEKGNYPPGLDATVDLNLEVDLTSAIFASVSFWAKWQVENDFDYVQFLISTDGGDTYNPMCGKYTNPGSVSQRNGEPLYDGLQSKWVKEEISLEEYLGETIQFRFRIVTDGFVELDGFYFDDFSVLTSEDLPSNSEDLIDIEFNTKIVPNPADDACSIFIENEEINRIGSVRVLNIFGQLMQSYKPSPEIKLATADLTSGIYLVEFVGTNNETFTKKIMIQH